MISVVRITDKRFVSSPDPPLVRTRIEGPALHPDSPFTSLVKERLSQIGSPRRNPPGALNPKRQVQGSQGNRRQASSSCRILSFVGRRRSGRPKAGRNSANSERENGEGAKGRTASWNPQKTQYPARG